MLEIPKQKQEESCCNSNNDIAYISVHHFMPVKFAINFVHFKNTYL